MLVSLTEVLSCVLTVLLVWVVSGLMVYASISRLSNKAYEYLDPDLMMVTAAVGVASNTL